MYFKHCIISLSFFTQNTVKTFNCTNKYIITLQENALLSEKHVILACKETNDIYDFGEGNMKPVFSIQPIQRRWHPIRR